MSPTPRAAAALGAIALLALVVGPLLAAMLAAALVGALIADANLARRPPRARRRVPSIVARGVPATLAIELTEETRRVRVRQARSSPEVELSPQEDDGGLEAELVVRRRGRFELPPATLRVRGPVGLATWDHEAGEAQELLVYPDLPAARRLALAVRSGSFREAGERSRGPLGLGTEFESIRDYLPDDDIRQVNWPATVRMGRPMSNQYRVEQDRDVICVLDCGRLMAAPLTSLDPPDLAAARLRERFASADRPLSEGHHPEDSRPIHADSAHEAEPSTISGGSRLGGATRLDIAIDAATAVGLVADELGDRCGTVAFDATVHRRLTPRRRGGDALVRAVFDLQPAPVDSDYELAFATIAGAKRALVIVFTDLIEEVAARSLVAAVPVLARRHEVVVAGVVDPDLDALLRARPESELDVYRAAAALDVLAARERAAVRVRGAGARVLETAPASLARACVGAYLSAKARARL